MLYIVNRSKSVTDADAQLIARACAYQLRYHVGPAWGKTAVPVVFSSTPRDAAPGSTVLVLVDSIDEPGALGYHTEIPGDVESAVIGVGVIMGQPGATVLHGEMSVAAVTSHEVCEWFIDPHCNLSADTNRGYAVALEVCDPVESDAYDVTLDGATKVSVSNYVHPAWFDPQAAATSRFDHLSKIKAAFAMDAGGYYVRIAQGRATQVFGRDFPEWKKELKNRPNGRGRQFLTRP